VKLRSGTVVVLLLAAVLAGGWLLYRHLIPPAWMHNFVADIALRATPDPNAPPPMDTRQATPRGLASHPYICFADLVPFPWDRVVFLSADLDPRTAPALLNATWPNNDLARFAKLMQDDDRYQLVVLLKGDHVIADEPFFTFWADLSQLNRPEGFVPETAVFTAAVQGGRYVLAPVQPPMPPACAVGRGQGAAPP
jgi:hypothetical protein